MSNEIDKRLLDILKGWRADPKIEALIKKEVTEEWLEKWVDEFDTFAYNGLAIDIDLVKQMLKEAGVEVAGK